MTPLPKHLEEMRDNKAFTHMRGLFRKPDAQEDFKDGFNSATSLMLKDLESMAKALEFYSSIEIPGGVSIKEVADNTLKNYRQKYGVSK